LLRPPLSSTLFPYTTLFRSSGSIEIFIELLDEQMMEQLRDVIAGRRACTLVTLFEDSERLGSRISRDAAFKNGFAQTIEPPLRLDRKSTRLNSSHDQISYAV